MLASRARAFGLLRGITRLSMGAPKRRASSAKKAAPSAAAAKKPKTQKDDEPDQPLDNDPRFSGPTYVPPEYTPAEIAEKTRKYGPTQHPDEYYETRKTDADRPAIAQALKASALVEDMAGEDVVLGDFLRWCTLRGFEHHPSLCVKNASPNGAPRHNAVYAKGDIAPGDVLVTMPKCWCLTARTGSITNVLPMDELANLDEAVSWTKFILILTRAIRLTGTCFVYYRRSS